MKRLLLFLIASLPCLLFAGGVGIKPGGIYPVIIPSGGTAAAPPADFLNDTMVEASTVTLESHTAGTGGAWSKAASQGGWVANVGKIGNTSYAWQSTSGAGKQWWQSAAVPTSSNYTLSVKYYCGTTANTGLYVCARSTASTQNGLCFWWPNAGGWEVGDFAGGTLTQRGAQSTSYPPTTERTMDLTVNGSNWTLSADGNVILSNTTTYTTAGNICIFTLYGTQSTGIRLRDMRAY